MSKPSIKITMDSVKSVNEICEVLKKMQTFVGIPENDGKRDEETPINNATLLFINNYGSPDNNIEPRPVMDIGIRRAQDDVSKEFSKAAEQAFSKGPADIGVYFERAGIIASNSVKTVINEQIGIDPPKDSTMKTRKSQGFRGNKSLIVTGQMRNAITYVVKGRV